MIPDEPYDAPVTNGTLVDSEGKLDLFLAHFSEPCNATFAIFLIGCQSVIGNFEASFAFLCSSHRALP